MVKSQKNSRRRKPLQPKGRQPPKLPDEVFKFEECDVSALVAALGVVPELLVSAAAVKELRKRRVRFPIKTFRPIARILPEKVCQAHGHTFSAAHVKHYMTKELFPIQDELGLARAIYLALLRCNAAFAWAQQAPQNAEAVLCEYKQFAAEMRKC